MDPRKPALPIDEFLPSLRELLRTNNALVLTAAPGAGKTTRLPPACLDLVAGQILVLEPRRMAAVAAASRIAEENGWTPGREVGWQVRFDNRTVPDTRLVFLTEALLARRMVRDPELAGVDLVILDEFHERSLHTDLTLGLLKELRELGRDVKLIVMSATLTAERISDYLGGAPIVAVPGRLFDLEIRHQKAAMRLRTDFEFIDQVAETVKTAHGASDKDILVFLPGVGEIERTRERLSDWAAARDLEIVALHGSLPLEEQRRALRRGTRRRVLLSTNIAESSVTVDGVGIVVDSGLAKVNRFDVRTGFSRLELSRISLSSAIQRSGRAARQFPGLALRMWSKHDELAMPKDETPEVQRADLSEALLFLANQGVTDFRSFPWFETPPTNHLDAAENVLRHLGAVDAAHRITDKGRALLKFPLPPRIAGLMLAAEDLERVHPGAVEMAAKLAALLQERDFVRADVSRGHVGDRLECDLTLRLHLLERMKPRQILQAAEQIRRLSLTSGSRITKDEDLIVRRLLLRAFPDRLCRRRGDTDRGLMAGGRGVKLAPESLVRESEFFLAIGGVEGLSDAETTINLACGMTKDFVLRELGERVERRRDLFVDETKGQIFAREARFHGDLALDEASLRPATAEQIAEKLPDLLTAQLAKVLEKNEALARWFERWNFLSRIDAEAGQTVFDSTRLKAIFTEAAYGEKSVDSVASKDLVYFFEQALPANLAERLRREVPDRISVPSGSRLPVRYPSDKEPYLEVRLQEVFGWTETPKVMGLPVTMHLLGPNFRPVQVTADLGSFWKNGYPEVRKELRARYPKHSWPDDPLTAKAEAKGRPRF